ncbi:hypothetical protein EHS13_09525 [Paenibacillus psychroresistens]|uniref:peptidylprolyl isomerase n=1 Tax=Paenibacillus psychroresistens TaxID=1778678 RepID=A0A6B8RGN9_9BACL|nr:hypothetical protein [Paenibacillus psychroresistens]QGQ95107.1 hypothetical protein EHS13_09525 [Paenibacillus psychroresistens]
MRSTIPLRYLVLTCFLLLFAFVCAFLWITHKPTAVDTIVATVNSEPVQAQELRFFMNKHRAEIVQFYKQSYNIEMSKSFWTTKIQGEAPAERLKRLALEDVSQVKLVQILAKATGLNSYLDYSAFLKAWHAENVRRAAAVEKGAVIYGPIQYDEAMYFDYIHNNLIHQIQAKLTEQAEPLDENKLQVLYDSLKESIFKKEPITRVQLLSAPYLDRNGNIDSDRKKLAEMAMRQVESDIKEGINFDVLAQAFIQQNNIGVDLKERILNDSTARLDYKEDPEFTKEVSLLKIGESSKLLELDNAYMIINVKARLNGGYRGMAEVKDILQLKYAEELYHTKLEELSQHASIVKNERLLYTFDVSP